MSDIGVSGSQSQGQLFRFWCQIAPLTKESATQICFRTYLKDNNDCNDCKVESGLEVYLKAGALVRFELTALAVIDGLFYE